MLSRIVLLTALFAVLFVVPCGAQTSQVPTPQNLKATVNDGPAVNLSWDAPAGLWLYKVYRADAGSSTYQIIGIASATHHTDITVTPGRAYLYSVSAAGLVGGSVVEGAKSEPAAVTIPASTTQGVVTGTVTDEADGTGIPYAQVLVSSTTDTTHWVQVVTDLNGSYSVTLDPGTYALFIAPPYSSMKAWQAEWYDNAADRAHATPVVVVAGATLMINITLGSETPQGQGLLAGTVVDDVSGAPVSGAKVIVFRTHYATPMAAWTRTGADGSYELAVPAGEYYVRVESPVVSDTGTSYVPEWYDDAQDVSGATAVTVTPGDTATADFALMPVSPPIMVALSGRVTDTTGTPLADACVVVMKSVQETAELACAPGAVTTDLGSVVDVATVGECHGVVWTGKTDALGEYKGNIRGDRTYIVLAAKAGYIPEYYNDKHSPLTADRIVVGVTDTAGVDFALARCPDVVFSIGGLVTNSDGKGIPSRVMALPVAGIIQSRNVRFCNTDSAGVFLLSNVSVGRYILMAIPHCGYAPAFYKAGAYGVLHWKEADVLDVQGDIAGLITIGVVQVKGFGVAWLRGHVRSDASLPLTGANVIVVSAESEVLGYSVTDADGAFAIAGVAPGSVDIYADLGGFDAATVTVSVPDGSPMINGIDLTLNSIAVSSGSPGDLPVVFRLSQNYPNPFNPKTVVSCQLPVASTVKLAVYDLLGREVEVLIDEYKAPGTYSATWDATGKASGIYFYRLRAGAFTDAKRMLLLR